MSNKRKIPIMSFLFKPFDSNLKVNITNFFLILIVIILSVWSRWYKLDSFASNIDDHLVAVSILEAKRPINVSSIKSVINDSSITSFNSPPKSFLRYLESKGQLELTLTLLDPFRPFVCVPNQSTYAPIQFFFTNFLVNENQSLKQILFWGRFPSFIFSVMSIFLFYKLIRVFSLNKQLDVSDIIVIAFFSFSLESIIYAKQMESYAIGIFAVIILMIILIDILKKVPEFSYKRWLLFTFLMVILVYMQYQILIYVLAAIITIFIYYYNNSVKDKRMVLLRRIIPLGLFFIFMIALIYITFIVKHSNHASEQWYKGPKGEYLFSLDTSNGFLRFFCNTFYFIIYNSWEVFLNNFEYYAGNSKILNSIMRTLIFCYAIIFLYGLVAISKSNQAFIKYFRLFIVIFICIWFLFVLLGKLTMSPTRHTMILQPIFCIISYIGLNSLSSAYYKQLVFNLISYLIVFFVICSFSLGIKPFLDERTEPFTQDSFVNEIKRRNPDFIVTKSEIIKLMPELRDSVNILFVSNFKSKIGILNNNSIKKRAQYCFINYEPSTENIRSIAHLLKIDPSKLIVELNVHGEKYRISRHVNSDELHFKFPRIVENHIWFAKYSD